MAVTDLDLGRYKLGWSDAEDYVFKPKRGLDTDIVNEMSWMKGEPDWMLKNRLKSYRAFERRPMPNWGGDMSEIYFDDIFYYIKPTKSQVDEWDELPDAIKQTYEKLGIPEAERARLAGRRTATRSPTSAADASSGSCAFPWEPTASDSTRPRRKRSASAACAMPTRT